MEDSRPLMPACRNLRESVCLDEGEEVHRWRVLNTAITVGGRRSDGRVMETREKFDGMFPRPIQAGVQDQLCKPRTQRREWRKQLTVRFISCQGNFVSSVSVLEQIPADCA